MTGVQTCALPIYDSDANASSSWEEELVKSLEKSKIDENRLKEIAAPSEGPDDEYAVNVPEVPESMKKML